MAFNIDIVAAARENDFFRRVVSTGPNAQVVLMCIPPNGEIGEEVHDRVDQLLADPTFQSDPATPSWPAKVLRYWRAKRAG